MKNNWKHLTFEQRKIIASGISKTMKLKEIAELIDMDPTSVSKEVKRNRIPYKNSLSNECPKLNRWPYVCTFCSKRYQQCIYKKYKYVAKVAQQKADANLISTRRGVDLNSDEHKNLNSLVSEGIKNNMSIYQIKVENDLSQSVSTLYRYVNNGLLDAKRYDLPYAAKYKKRKHTQKYDYSTSNKKIDRTNHTYLDYLAYMKGHTWCNVWQLDFLGNKRGDKNALLSLVMPDLQFPLIKLIHKPNSSNVAEFFDNLELSLGTNVFTNIFQVILTDRDPCFSNFDNLMTSKINGKKRFELFYCDPYVSSQKPNIENLNRQLRKFFPKGKSMDSYTKEYVHQSWETVINIPKKSLDNFTSREAFIKLFGYDTFNKLS